MDMPMTPEGFLNMAQNMVRLNCLKHNFQQACTCKVMEALNGAMEPEVMAG